MLIPDDRRLRLFRALTRHGAIEKELAAEISQEKDGVIRITGLWKDSFDPSPEDLKLSADFLSLSPLERLRLRLLLCSGLVVEEVIE